MELPIISGPELQTLARQCVVPPEHLAINAAGSPSQHKRAPPPTVSIKRLQVPYLLSFRCSSTSCRSRFNQCPSHAFRARFRRGAR